MLFRPLPESYSVPHGVHTDWLTDAGGTCRIHVTAACGAGLRVGWASSSINSLHWVTAQLSKLLGVKMPKFIASIEYTTVESYTVVASDQYLAGNKAKADFDTDHGPMACGVETTAVPLSLWDTTIRVSQERGELNICLSETDTETDLVEWCGEEAIEAIEDGFLSTKEAKLGNLERFVTQGGALHQSAFAYWNDCIKQLEI